MAKKQQQQYPTKAFEVFDEMKKKHNIVYVTIIILICDRYLVFTLGRLFVLNRTTENLISRQAGDNNNSNACDLSNKSNGENPSQVTMATMATMDRMKNLIF